MSFTRKQEPRISNTGRTADFGEIGVMVKEDTNEATDTIFISLKDPSGDIVTAHFTIEDAIEIIATLEECIALSTLARHGRFSRPS